MSVRSRIRRRGRRALFLALPVLAAALAPTAAQASWPGLNGWESFSSNRFDTAISGDTSSSCRRSGCRRSSSPPRARTMRSPRGRPTAGGSPSTAAARGQQRAVRLSNPDGSDQTPPDENSFRVSEGQPAWSPDGTRLLYRQTPDNPITQNADIWQIDVDPAAPNARPVLERTGDERYPSYSPDGTRSLFRGDQDLVDPLGRRGALRHERRRDGRPCSSRRTTSSTPRRRSRPTARRSPSRAPRDSGDPLAPTST